MSAVVSNALVVIAIVVAALYSVWRLGPRRMRDAVRRRLNLESNSAGACDACGGCPPATNPPAARKEHAVLWRKKPVR